MGCFTDGSVYAAAENAWAMPIVLRDGRTVTAAGTAGAKGSKPKMAAIRHAAENHGIPVDLALPNLMGKSRITGHDRSQAPASASCSVPRDCAAMSAGVTTLTGQIKGPYGKFLDDYNNLSKNGMRGAALMAGVTPGQEGADGGGRVVKLPPMEGVVLERQRLGDSREWVAFKKTAQPRTESAQIKGIAAGGGRSRVRTWVG